MKKFFKYTAIIVGILLLLVIIVAFPMAKTMMSFTPAPTGVVTSDLSVANDKFIGVYVLKVKDGFVCFDAGNDVKNTAAELKKIEVDPALVKAVFLTHSDGDHVNALPLYVNAKVYLSKAEDAMITGDEKRKFMFMKSKVTLPIKNYETLEDGQEIVVGGAKIKAMLTPGHTIGSTTYIVNGKYAIVGDLAILKEGKLSPMPKPPSEEPSVVAESLKKVEELKGIELVGTAHGGIIQRQATSNKQQVTRKKVRTV